MRRILAPLLILALALVGCGGTDGAPSGGSESVAVADGSLTWGSGGYGVVLAHGAAFDAASWEDQAVQIADQGATVVAVEDTSPESLQAAVADLMTDGIEDVALVGGSAGADAILQLASTEPDLADQLILLSPNAPQDLEGEQPKLFIASEDEPVADVSRELAESSAGDENIAEILPGSAHAQNIFDGDQGDEVLQLILDRLSEFT
ncbi:MAG: alpha/beta fold hydrolase [Nocardioides sp.]